MAAYVKCVIRVSTRIFEWGSNRRQCGQPTPKHPKMGIDTGFLPVHSGIWGTSS